MALPLLDEAKPSSKAVVLERTTGRRAVDEKYVMSVEGKRYEGTRESFGASAANNSCYVTVTLNEDSKTMTLTPLGEWYAFRPEVTHKTIGLEDAEMLMERTDRRSILQDQKLQDMLTKKKGGEEEEEEEGGPADGKNKNKSKVDFVDDDEFDDGAGINWSARADEDEDGNEGLDMADEELFEDDEDDTNEAILQRDGAYGRDFATDELQALQDTTNARLKVQKEIEDRVHDTDGIEADELAAYMNDDEPNGAADASWGKTTKEALKAQRAQQRRDEDSEDDSDDSDDEFEDVKASLNRQASEQARHAEEAAAAAAAAAAVKTEVASSGAGGKRALSPGSGAEASVKRAKSDQELQRTAAAAASGGVLGAATSVLQEKDIVMIIHKRRRITLKELLKQFKPYFTVPKDKEVFFEMVKRVSVIIETIIEVGPDGKPKLDKQGKPQTNSIIQLKEATLVEYDLDDPNA